MQNFDHIFNWKLMSGSHDFPGPDGGTCINEAAIVAAGFEYRKVKSAHDCPPCFSRPIAAYAIIINDQMPYRVRNELLMPFVTKLSGTADTPAIESQRVDYLAIETVRRLLALTCSDCLKRDDLAAMCREVKTIGWARVAADAVYDAVHKMPKYFREVWGVAGNSAKAAKYAAMTDISTEIKGEVAEYAVWHAALAASHAAAGVRKYATDARRAHKHIWSIAVDILAGAIAIGKQSQPDDEALIVKRMEAAKEKIYA